MEGKVSNLGYTAQEKHDLEWGYYMTNFVTGAWDVLAREDIDQDTNFIFFSHPDTHVNYIINEVVFSLNEFSIGFVMRTMETIAKRGWSDYRENRIEAVIASSK